MTCELLDGSIFLHIPKTGGTWTYQVLSELKLVRRPAGKNAGGHSDYTRAVFYPNNKPRWREWSQPQNRTVQNMLSGGRYAKLPYTFCFVRHPVKWYESAFRFFPTIPAEKRDMWINDEAYIKRWHPFRVVCRCLHADFSQFVRNLLNEFPGYVTWLYNQFAPPEISFVGKQENLRQDLLAVLRERHFTIDEAVLEHTPNANESKSTEPIRWDPGLLREVQNVEGAALRRFGYQPLEMPASVRQPAAYR